MAFLLTSLGLTHTHVHTLHTYIDTNMSQRERRKEEEEKSGEWGEKATDSDLTCESCWRSDGVFILKITQRSEGTIKGRERDLPSQKQWQRSEQNGTEPSAGSCA